MPRKKPSTRVVFRSPAQLQEVRAHMWSLVQTVADCAEADWQAAFAETELYALYLHAGQIIGFSSVMEADFETGGRKISTIGLGQTLILPAYRNQYLVQRALIYRWWRQFLRTPRRPIYIWGACISYKSYLSFVKVLKVVYPHPEIPTPPQATAVMHCIGRRWYGADYVPETHLCITRNFRLVDESTRPQAADLEDDWIRYYQSAVPDMEGDTPGLLTLSPCIRANFLPMVRGWLRKLLPFRKRKRRP